MALLDRTASTTRTVIDSLSTADLHKVHETADGQPENWLELAEAKEPFGRLLQAHDIAKLTAYLLSDDAEMMTGSLIDFDQHVIGALD